MPADKPKWGGARPGSGRKKRSPFTAAVREDAMRKLEEAVSAGEPWAITFIGSRMFPAPRPVTQDGTLDAEKMRAEIELTYAKIHEITELEKRIAALEGDKE